MRDLKLLSESIYAGLYEGVQYKQMTPEDNRQVTNDNDIRTIPNLLKLHLIQLGEIFLEQLNNSALF